MRHSLRRRYGRTRIPMAFSTNAERDVFYDTAKSADRRRIWPGKNVVVDRAYAALRKARLIARSGHGFSAHYVLTSAGRKALESGVR